VSATDLAIVLVTLVTVAALVVLVVALVSISRTLRELRSVLADVQRDALPLVADLRDTVAQAGAEVERVDDLLDTAASIQQTVDAASRLTYVAFSNPLIKIVAFFRGIGRGTGRAVGRGGRRRRRLDARRAERETPRAA
jgi:hypothetical protein